MADDGFTPQESFGGARAGFAFKLGAKGLGYYRTENGFVPARASKRIKRDAAGGGGGRAPGGAQSLSPPVVKPGDYVQCSYYPRDLFMVKAIRVSLSKPPFWSCELVSKLQLGCRLIRNPEIQS